MNIFAGEGEIGVVLDTNITEELKEEGYVREVISKVQNLRKDSGLEVEDKITLFVKDNDMLLNVISRNEEQIAKIVLAVEVKYNEEADYQEFSINGEKLLVSLKKV